MRAGDADIDCVSLADVRAALFIAGFEAASAHAWQAIADVRLSGGGGFTTPRASAGIS
jgi:hypothetical protein